MSSTPSAVIGRSSSLAAEALRRDLLRGRYTLGGYLPPLRQLAQDSGVAYVTIGRALKELEREGFVHGEPRRGYRIMRLPTSRSARPFFAFVAWNDPRGIHIWGELHKAQLAGFQVCAEAPGIPAWIPLSFSGEDPVELVEQVRRTGAGGVAINCANPDFITALRAASLPVVLIGAFLPDRPIDCVLQDNFRGGFLAGEYLARRGHLSAAWFGNSNRSIHYHERLGGALAGLRSGGATLAEESMLDVAEAPTPTPELVAQARAFLSRPDRPRGVLALWQVGALALLQAAAELSLRLPGDLDLITWGVDELRDEVYRPRTPGGRLPAMVTWSVRQMAEASLGRLAELASRPGTTPLRLNLPVRLAPGD